MLSATLGHGGGGHGGHGHGGHGHGGHRGYSYGYGRRGYNYGNWWPYYGNTVLVVPPSSCQYTVMSPSGEQQITTAPCPPMTPIPMSVTIKAL